MEIFFRKFTIVEGTTKFDLLEKIRKIYPRSKIELNELSDFFVADTYYYNVAESANELIKNISKSSSEILNKLWSKRYEELAT